MGLFSKREPCAICGGKVSGLFPWKIEGRYVCNDCHGVSDLPDGMEKSMTLDQFNEYRLYRDENQKLKSSFVPSQVINFGLLDTKIVFDFENQMFCMDKNLNKTIFHGCELKSFSVKEDNMPLFEASEQGLTRIASKVPERVASLAPRIAQYRTERQLQEMADRLVRQDNGSPSPNRTINVPEPFHSFNVQLNLAHPYWQVIRCDMTGPIFNNDYPDTGDYMRDYQRDLGLIEQLVQALMQVAFPGVSPSVSGAESKADPKAQAAQAPGAAPADTAAELRKFKALMDDGVITPEEFEAKKRQLLNL